METLFFTSHSPYGVIGNVPSLPYQIPNNLLYSPDHNSPVVYATEGALLFITIPDSLIHSVSIVPCKPDLKIVIIKKNLLKPVQHMR